MVSIIFCPRCITYNSWYSFEYELIFIPELSFHLILIFTAIDKI
jgi:hypothetical protein